MHLSTRGQRCLIIAGVSHRKALLHRQVEKTDVRHELQPEEQQEPEDEKELGVTIEGAEEDEEEEESAELWDGQISLSTHQEKNPSLLFPSSQVEGAPGQPACFRALVLK